ncbi:MAG TPA: hypothetical protein VLG09_04240 [Candidatus Saccharimonadales bacterium]|nr:hypothetical protein [Candidatus Saccharimonadales bacterium]
MARFALKDKHYLNVPGTIWEQKETNQQTGKQHRMDYPVGLYLDPSDPSDWNYPMTRQIVVTTKRSNQYPGDILFVGPPTFDMEPLDEEAEAMIAELGKKRDPFSELPATVGETFSERMLKLLEERLTTAQIVAPSGESDRISTLEAKIEELTKLLSASQEAKTTPSTRRQ